MHGDPVSPPSAPASVQATSPAAAGPALCPTRYLGVKAGLSQGTAGHGALLRDAGRLSGIPGVLAHGRLDLAGPAVTP
jgi:hypothetical protein